VVLVAWTDTVMSTTPALWPGLTAVICVSESTWKLKAGVAPNSTSIAREKPVPVITTELPAFPVEGTTFVTAGGAL
jgi:hypothetical protein